MVRPKGVRPRAKPLPPGLDPARVVAILTGSNYKVAARLWLSTGYELASRAVVDTGSGVSLIRRELLPKGTVLKPVDKDAESMYDVNGGILPIVGELCMHARIGSHLAEVNLGVVSGMSVPMILGTDYTDLHMPDTCGAAGYIRMGDSSTVPICRRDRTISEMALMPEPEGPPDVLGKSAPVMVSKAVTLSPRSRGYVQICTTFQGKDLVVLKTSVYDKHQVQIASRTMTCTAGDKWWVEVLNTAKTPRRLPARMGLGYISRY